MKEIVIKILLAGDKFMPEMHLKQPGFTYSACNSFTKNEERSQKSMQTGDTRYIYRNNLRKTLVKDLVKRIESDKALKDKVFKVASDAR